MTVMKKPFTVVYILDSGPTLNAFIFKDRKYTGIHLNSRSSSRLPHVLFIGLISTRCSTQDTAVSLSTHGQRCM
jgi:hypothetical protein